jgi:hypothetical protein
METEHQKLALDSSRNTFPISKLFIFRKKIFTNFPHKQRVMGLLILSQFNIPNQLMINIENREECSRIVSASDELTTPSVEDKYLEGASLCPQKDLNIRHPLPDKNSSPIV